jgi:hypothetical protein
MTLPERVRARVRVNRRGCWIWQGPRIRGDYGCISNKAGQRPVNVGVHRVMYEDAHGPIPDRMVIAHLCGVRLCCNPAHLALARRHGRSAAVVASSGPGQVDGSRGQQRCER